MFISHDLRLVSHVSDTIAVMYRGRFVELGPADSVALNPGHEYTKLLYASIPGPELRNREKSVAVKEYPEDDPGQDGGYAMTEIRDGHFILQKKDLRRQ